MDEGQDPKLSDDEVAPPNDKVADASSDDEDHNEKAKADSEKPATDDEDAESDNEGKCGEDAESEYEDTDGEDAESEYEDTDGEDAEFVEDKNGEDAKPEEPMTPRFLDGTLPADVEHRWHNEFLFVSEVSRLQRVSSGIRLHIRQLLQTRVWDVKYGYRRDCVLAWLGGLLASRVNIRSMEMSYPGEAMAYALKFLRIQELTLLLRHFPSQVNRSASLHGEKYLPLHRAARYGTLEIVRLLLNEKDIDAYAKDDKGLTALHHAVQNTYPPKKEETLKIVKHLAALPNMKLLDERFVRHHATTLDVARAATGKKARDPKAERLASALHSTVNRN